MNIKSIKYQDLESAQFITNQPQKIQCEVSGSTWVNVKNFSILKVQNSNVDVEYITVGLIDKMKIDQFICAQTSSQRIK